MEIMSKLIHIVIKMLKSKNENTLAFKNIYLTVYLKFIYYWIYRDDKKSTVSPCYNNIVNFHKDKFNLIYTMNSYV